MNCQVKNANEWYECMKVAGTWLYRMVPAISTLSDPWIKNWQPNTLHSVFRQDMFT